MSVSDTYAARLATNSDDDFDDGSPLCSVMFSVATLVVVLVVFKVIYERWVTPLAKVPGPFLHSVTSIPMRVNMLRGRMPDFCEALHRRYGPVVRISPQRVSFSDAAVVKQVLATHAFVKPGAYEVPKAVEPNTFSTQSPEVSIERRRQVGPGFSHRHLHQMEGSILQCGVVGVQRRLDALLTAAAEQHEPKAAGGRAVVVQYYQWFSLVTLDTIGLLGFGRKFHALERGGHELVPALNWLRTFNYVTMALPWLKRVPLFVSRRVPWVRLLLGFSQSAIDERRQRAPDPDAAPDLLQLILDPDSDGGSKLTDAQMVSETLLHLIAGVDTTTAGLTWTLALLLHNPHIMERLTTDIRREFPDRAVPIDYDACRQRLPYLAAVISESLRVLSPAPSILPRVAPTGGVRMAGYYLPAGTWLCCPLGAVHKNPATFRAPLAFDPERFMGDGDEKHSLLAFSTGVRACLGRNLALLEMNVVLANLLRSYDLRLPENAVAADCVAPQGSEKSAAGVVPDIPRWTMLTLNPIYPDRDCLVVVSPAPE
ncbi:hypothetical protein IWQ56_000807 [Coemansia nantahalensis]|nr:hypothetical protein IWQ56_000807 [Coemansia nantahalensis]